MNGQEHNPLKIGNKVVVMSPTHYWMGKVVGYDAFSIFLILSCWIPEIGRHHKVFATGVPDKSTEIEPHPDDLVASAPRVGSAVLSWHYDLWREPKAMETE